MDYHGCGALFGGVKRRKGCRCSMVLRGRRSGWICTCCSVHTATATATAAASGRGRGRSECLGRITSRGGRRLDSQSNVYVRSNIARHRACRIERRRRCRRDGSVIRDRSKHNPAAIVGLVSCLNKRSASVFKLWLFYADENLRAHEGVTGWSSGRGVVEFRDGVVWFDDKGAGGGS